jgi:hypothetical protein
MKNVQIIHGIWEGSREINRMREVIDLMINTFISHTETQTTPWSDYFTRSAHREVMSVPEKRSVWKIFSEKGDFVAPATFIVYGHRTLEDFDIRSAYRWSSGNKMTVRMTDVQDVYEDLPTLIDLMRKTCPDVEQDLWGPFLRAASAARRNS